MKHGNVTQQKKKFSRSKPQMTQMLELADRIFSITAINMGKGLVKQMGNMCEHTDNFSREMESIKRKPNGNSSTEKV